MKAAACFVPSCEHVFTFPFPVRRRPFPDGVHGQRLLSRRRYGPAVRLSLIHILGAGDITDWGSRYVQVTRGGKTVTYDYFSIKDLSLIHI